MRARRVTWALSAIGAAGLVVLGARSPTFRASLAAGWKAFNDPALLDPKPPPPPSAVTVSCARFDTAGETKSAEIRDDDVQGLDRAVKADDLDDPEGEGLASLTMPDLKAPITRRTLRYLRWFTKSEQGRAAFLQRYRRSGLYREAMAHALREAGLPEDLIWLAAIESGFDPRAVSPTGASGLWQFMPETAQLYDLEQSVWTDERRNIAQSTKAAITHLRDLYERFGRWDLALAAYNAGYSRVVSAMSKVEKQRGPTGIGDKPLEFSDLCAARALPEETANYVPQIMAFALAAANRSRFGLDQAELGTGMEAGEIAVPEGTRLRTIARAAGVSIQVLRDYNPQLLRDRVPPNGGDYLVALPEARVQRALASFPVYHEQEVVADSDADEGDAADAPAVSATAGMTVDPNADDPLPKRPIPLGRNRLPQFALPGQERVIASAAQVGLDILSAKLPQALAMPTVGWRGFANAEPAELPVMGNLGATMGAGGGDPLGVFSGEPQRRGGALAAKGRDQAIDRELAFLDGLKSPVEALRSYSLPNGITVRVRRDKGAKSTAITVRIATLGADAPAGLAPGNKVAMAAQKGAESGAAEALYTITVDKADTDAGVELASTRLRLALGDTGGAGLAQIRRRAGEPRRQALEKEPYGAAWITLGDALFPAGHPLAGTVLGSTNDGASLRDLLIAEAMRKEHEGARASITVVGDLDEARTKKLAEAFLGNLGTPVDVPVLPHPKEERLTVEDAVPSARLLFGWIGPAEGEVGDASLRVAVEILENPKLARLTKSLVERAGVASLATAGIEITPRASVTAIELAPAAGHELAELEKKLDQELEKLGTEGPAAVDVEWGKYLVRARIKREMAAASQQLPGGAISSGSLAKLRHALKPGAGDRALAALDEVTVSSVKAAVHRILGKDRRVVVTTLPRSTTLAQKAP